jgi:hypothetical protein
MKVSKRIVGSAVLVLLMILSVSFEVLAQGRGRRASRWNKKCEKFVNCHDARDGRWDGRGPNRRIVFDRRFRRNRRHRDDDRDFDRITRRRRNRDRDDRDQFRRGRRN